MVETEYVVRSKSEQILDKIMPCFGRWCRKATKNSFKSEAIYIFEVMEKAVLAANMMKAENIASDFCVFGRLYTDYECILFQIDFENAELFIKTKDFPIDENEDRYWRYCDMELERTKPALKKSERVSFKQAIEGEIVIGPVPDKSYEEWMSGISDSV